MMHHILFRIIFIIVITAPAGISTIKGASAEQDSGVLHSPQRTILPGEHREVRGESRVLNVKERRVDEKVKAPIAGHKLPVASGENRPEPIGSDTLWEFNDVEELLSQLSLEQKVGQLFSIRAHGKFSNIHDPDLIRIERQIADHHIGGVTFFTGDVYGQAVLHNRLQRAASIPLWISQDMESGAAMRIEGATRLTPAMGVAASGDPENAYWQGKVTASEARALKVNQIFAPVLDVNNNPLNPVIGTRSYSADPEIVAEYGIKFMEGVESEGILATGKHFPGHGDTDTDSHFSMPTLSHTYERLKTVELLPFERAIDEGLRSVMSAHIAFPSISGTPGLPATLDPAILQRILVDSLQFDGLVVTDGLEMRGITNHYSPAEAAIMALHAGADILLLSPDELSAIDGMIKAVESGRVSENRIDHSVRKLLTLKTEQNLFEDRFVEVESLKNRINTPENQAIADRIARESVTVLKNNIAGFPITKFNTNQVLLLAASDQENHPAGSVLAREVRKYHPTVVYKELHSNTTAKEMDEILWEAEHSDLVITGSFITTRAVDGGQFPEQMFEVLKQIENLSTPAMLLSFGSPYAVKDLPGFDAHILAWSSTEHQLRNTIPSIFGGSAISGNLPVEIPELYEIGWGIHYPRTTLRLDTPESAGMITDSLMKIDEIMQKAINDSVFPGGVVAVMRNGKLVWEEAYGYHDYTKTAPTSIRSVYDLASISKIMATTAAIMKLKGEGKISLDDPISKYIPEYQEGEKQKITIRHFLLHTSGLPAFRVYVDKLKSRPELIHAIKNEPLVNSPGEVYVYSDLGPILLGEIIFMVSGKPLDEYVREEIYLPMGMLDTTFNPEYVLPGASMRIPPTEIDKVYNRGLVHMKVHDERAFFLGGVAGHAGLFSTARDIAIFSDMLLQNGLYAGDRILQPEIIEQFTNRQSPINYRGYGFDRKDLDREDDYQSHAGTLTGDRTYGHTGFTGTSLWIDPDEQVAIILLTNRTYPDRSYGRTIRFVRSDIADTVINSIRK